MLSLSILLPLLLLLGGTNNALGYINPHKSLPKSDAATSRIRFLPTDNEGEASRTEEATKISMVGYGLSNVHSSVAIPLLIPPTTATLSALEAWCLSHLDEWYRQSQSVKCPFLRRRWGDLLDNVEMLVKNSVIRRECWPLMGPPQAWRPAGCNKKLQRIKHKDLSWEEIKQHVLEDWKPDTGKGYYVTGKITTAIYRDDCYFSGPDPDMPIRGLRKYMGVAAHLFDVEESLATLNSLDVVDDTLVAQWHLRGVIKLPWKPTLPSFNGKTVYHFDEEGLIDMHEEFWSMSAAHAFCHTLLPDLAKLIWKEENGPEAV